jgi:hypothetical protein
MGDHDLTMQAVDEHDVEALGLAVGVDREDWEHSIADMALQPRPARRASRAASRL